MADVTEAKTNALVESREEKRNKRVQLSGQLRKVWEEIGFAPTSFQLEDEQEEEIAPW